MIYDVRVNALPLRLVRRQTVGMIEVPEAFTVELRGRAVRQLHGVLGPFQLRDPRPGAVDDLRLWKLPHEEYLVAFSHCTGLYFTGRKLNGLLVILSGHKPTGLELRPDMLIENQPILVQRSDEQRRLASSVKVMHVLRYYGPHPLALLGYSDDLRVRRGFQKSKGFCHTVAQSHSFNGGTLMVALLTANLRQP